MENTKKIALERAIALLHAAGCTYAIIDADGNHHGTLEVKPAKAAKKASRRTGYDYTKLYKDVYDKLQPGQSVIISAPKDAPAGVTLNHIASALSGAAIARWGRGSTIVAQTADRTAVEVLRVM